MIYSTVFSFFFTLFAVYILVPPARKLAIKSRFVDRPGGRKQHQRPVPPIGGLIIFPVFIIVSLLQGADIAFFWPLYAGLIVLLVTGTLDERKQLRAWPKFIVQVCVASAVVLSGHARLFQLGDLFGFGDVGLTFLSIPFSIIAVVLLINAMNLLDGLDGLAGGYAAIALFWLMVAAGMTGAFYHVHAMAPLLGAVLGFLLHNMRAPWRRKASIFLGDAGSMGLGLTLAWFCIALAQQREQVLPPISVAWILALPAIDTCAQFYRRMREGRHPFSPDREHFHHHFIQAGVTIGRSVVLILGIAFICGAAGYFGMVYDLPQAALTAGWLALLIVHIALSQNPKTYIRLIQKLTR